LKTKPNHNLLLVLEGDFSDFFSSFPVYLIVPTCKSISVEG